jgi:tRNA pseudouridine38-40 synthase
MKSNNVKITLSYDGTDYFGFQSQAGGNTIADKLIKAIKKIEGEPPAITCAGRTDAGVHAEGQVVNFFTKRMRMDETNWLSGINSSLPDDIRVLKCEFVPETFSARNSAYYREYWYTIINAPVISALKNRYALHYRYPVDIGLMNEYCAEILGEKNFTAFSASTDSSISKNRFVRSALVENAGGEIVFKIVANAFLHKMIRIIVGTFLRLQKENAPASEVKKIMLSADRTISGPTAPPNGLVFKRVYYEEMMNTSTMPSNILSGAKSIYGETG